MRPARLRTSALALAILATLALPTRMQADPPLASEYSHTCDAVETSVHPGSRVEIKCSPPWSNPSTSATVSSFAVAASSSLAGPAAQVALAGQTSSKKVRIRFKTSSSDNPAGCGGDCRKLVNITLLN